MWGSKRLINDRINKRFKCTNCGGDNFEIDVTATYSEVCGCSVEMNAEGKPDYDSIDIYDTYDSDTIELECDTYVKCCDCNTVHELVRA
jgi:hypothetical protein